MMVGEDIHEVSPRPRARMTRTRKMGRFVGALGQMVKEVLIDDLHTLGTNLRLFFGLGATLVGLLSYTSDRYCDGNTSTYYACTRPSTYYYYPWWAILLVVVGSWSVVLWFLRKKSV